MKHMNRIRRLTLEAASPQQLNANLNEVIEKQGVRPCMVAVSISDPRVMICPFQLEGVAAKDIKHHLLSEAVEIMSLTPDAIVLDFEIIKSDEKEVCGIYMYLPKTLFEEYLAVLDKKGFNAIKITARSLVSIDWLFQHNKLNEGRICFLDFSVEGTINLFISNKQECELVRKIRYEYFDEAQKEIVQSLRSASAKSRVKQYDHIYYHGGFDGIDQLISSLNKIFHVKTEDLEGVDQKESLAIDKKFFRLNFLREAKFSSKQVKYIYAGVNIVLALCVMNLALVGLQMVKKNIKINRVKDLYQDAEYTYAVELRNNLK